MTFASAYGAQASAGGGAVRTGVRQLLRGKLTAADLELGKRLAEGRRLHYRSRVRFERVICAVPVNAADPIGWAKHLARQKLNLTAFGLYRVNGACGWDRSVHPEDGICEQGHCVVLTPAEAASVRGRPRLKASGAG